MSDLKRNTTRLGQTECMSLDKKKKKKKKMGREGENQKGKEKTA